jgi:hypothetical protein
MSNTADDNCDGSCDVADTGVDELNPVDLDTLFKDKPLMVKCSGCHKWDSAEDIPAIHTYYSIATDAPATPATPSNFCTTCHIDGTERRVMAAGHAPPVVRVYCQGCKNITHMYHTIESNEHVYSYCADCYGSGKPRDLFAIGCANSFVIGCLVCGKPAVPKCTVSFAQLTGADGAIIAKAACSIECSNNITAATRSSVSIEILCATCSIVLGGDIPAKKCSRCKVAYYCGARCQKLHWPAHQQLCKK